MAELGAEHETFVTGCGHVGDGNVHLALFQPDAAKRKAITREIFRVAVDAGGAISGEHGLGTEKAPYFLEMADPAALELMRSIKKVFDPLGILGPRPDAGRDSDRRDVMNGARALLSTLVDAGVDVCFANPGTSEMHFVAALDDVPAMRGILCLFEGVVTGAADGYGRVAGRPAATLLHLGPGLGNGLANLHNARRAHTPIVNIVGDHATYHARYDAPLQSDIASIAGAVSGWYRSTARCRRRRGGRGRRGGGGDGPPGMRRHARPARRRVVVRVVDGPVPATARAAAHRGAGRHDRRGRQGAAFGRAHGPPPRRRRAARRRLAGRQPGRRRPAPSSWARRSRPTSSAARASPPWSGLCTSPRWRRPSSMACAI